MYMYVCLLHETFYADAFENVLKIQHRNLENHTFDKVNSLFSL